jgi:hypothetical protein
VKHKNLFTKIISVCTKIFYETYNFVWWLNLLLKVKCWPYRKLLFTCIYFIRNYWTNDRYFTVNDVIINSFYKYLIWATIKIMGFECYFQQYFCYISDGQFYWWENLTQPEIRVNRVRDNESQLYVCMASILWWPDLSIYLSIYTSHIFCYISDGQFYWWGKLKHLQDTTDPSLSNLIYKLCKKKNGEVLSRCGMYR